MKETNMEHFRSEIEEIMARHKHFLPAVVDGKPIECEGLRCDKCMLYEATEPCSIHFVKWLLSEYKPEPVLTAREKHFVEFTETGWLARDEDGAINFYKSQRPVKVDMHWRPFNPEIYMPDCGDFPFITWEDEEAWSIERLRELKVKENE